MRPDSSGTASRNAGLRFLRRRVEQARRGAIDDGDLAVAVEADHAGAHARQHRFREAAARIDLVAGLDQLRALHIELRRHAVEGAAQRPISSSSRSISTCALRSPSDTRSAAPINREIGLINRFAAHRPSQIAASRMSSDTTA
jgi:hypothetical protein